MLDGFFLIALTIVFNEIVGALYLSSGLISDLCWHLHKYTNQTCKIVINKW